MPARGAAFIVYQKTHLYYYSRFHLLRGRALLYYNILYYYTCVRVCDFASYSLLYNTRGDICFRQCDPRDYNILTITQISAAARGECSEERAQTIII